MATDLKGKIALVTGATRQAGRGIAVALAAAGATVYITSRRTNPGKWPTQLGNPYWGSLNNAMREIKQVGGHAVAVRCDHTKDQQSRALLERIEKEQGRLDILVNAAWAGYDRMRGAFPEDGPFDPEASFWDQPLPFWDENFAGVRASYAVSALAAPLMMKQGHGLICHITYRSGRQYLDNVAYGVSHAAIDRLCMDMAADLKPHGIACLALCPMGHVEDVQSGDPKAESGAYIGRGIAALYRDPQLMECSGGVLGTRYIGRQYGVVDTNGRQPPLLDEEQWLKLYPEWR
ncbi:MAG: SDR family NAD(P)-dependent oxidoreductase [Candidatus Latescibacteria bacterium]|nr:SDR family NAD(P)-dependent oxidoreductase [Candidatus Latescibacterota bacterium]